ncbi:MAG: hypothetical protein WBQ86_06315 [Candidatus Binatus sp.]
MNTLGGACFLISCCCTDSVGGGGSVGFGDGSSRGIGNVDGIGDGDRIGDSDGIGDGDGIGEGDPGFFAGTNEGVQLPQNAAPSGFGLPHFLHAGIQVTLPPNRTIFHATRAIVISKFTPCALLRYQNYINMAQSQYSGL